MTFRSGFKNPIPPAPSPLWGWGEGAFSGVALNPKPTPHPNPLPNAARGRIAGAVNALLLLLALGVQQTALAATAALTVYGEPPKYPADFKHFDYVNPDAPKGGSLRRSAQEIGGFDHILPYIDKGTGITQLDDWLYSPLAVRSQDEPYTVYGLVAEKIERDAAHLWLRFTLNPKARFADGTPITAEDVRYTYELLTTQGSLQYRQLYADVKSVTVESEQQVRFDFKSDDNRTLPLDLAVMPVLPEHWWKTRDFANGGGFEPPLGSGPYRLTSIDPGRSVTFERNKDWWGKDLPPNIGQYNFDKLSIDFFADTEVARQVMRAGAYDYNREYSATSFTVGYSGPALDDGRLQRAILAPAAPVAPQGFAFNLQKPLFKDRRVREAIAMLWDFEWTNKQLMRDFYHRQQSYFPRTEMAATALPDAEELKLLEPLRGKVPDEVFNQVFVAPKTDGSGIIRDKQLKALALLESAGWHPQGDQLVNAEGEPLSFTFLDGQGGFDRMLLPFKRNLAQIGITFNLRRIDPAQYINRLMARDYDMVVVSFPLNAVVNPSPGRELASFYGSAGATDPGSQNYQSLQDPAVDQLIEGLIRAESRDTMVHYARALDRVLQWGYYWIPNYNAEGTPTVFWNRFGRPKVAATYDTGLETWWQVSETPLTNAEMAARLNSGQAH